MITKLNFIIFSDCKAAEVCISNKCRCGNGFDHGPTGCRDVSCVNK